MNSHPKDKTLKIPTLITSQPTVSIITLDNVVVDALLAMNTHNRIVRNSVVETYSRFIDAGLWVLTNQGIGVTATGLLLDGQHRLLAVKANGYPRIETVLVTGLSEGAAAAVDYGANRSTGDFMHFIFQTRIPNSQVAILRTILLARRNFNGSGTKRHPSEYVSVYSEFHKDISAVFDALGGQRFAASIVAALVYCHHYSDPESTLLFARALATGELLEANHPALALRRWIMNTQGRAGGEMTIDRYKKTINATLAFIEGRPLKLIRRRNSIFKKKRPLEDLASSVAP